MRETKEEAGLGLGGVCRMHQRVTLIKIGINSSPDHAMDSGHPRTTYYKLTSYLLLIIN